MVKISIYIILLYVTSYSEFDRINYKFIEIFESSQLPIIFFELELYVIRNLRLFSNVDNCLKFKE